jgi:hypothetical protein
MPYQAREVLIASSTYDRFMLEEDGPLGERVLSGHGDPAWAPRIHHAAGIAEARSALAAQRIDLVIATPRLADGKLGEVAAMVRQAGLPVIGLVFSDADLHQCPELLHGGVDHVLFWTGQSRDLVAILRLTEDARNVAHDTDCAGVRVILLVEDTPRHYSRMLPAVYSELLAQPLGGPSLERLLRARTRAKVLLATHFEEALAFADRYAPFLAGVISDARYDADGRECADAGPRLLRTLRQRHPDLPMLLQSTEDDAAAHVADLNVSFVNKSAPKWLAQVGEFLQRRLGYGPFVFRRADDTVFAQAHDLAEMEQFLRVVPIEEFVRHALTHAFSRWLTARALHPLAAELREKSMADFAVAEDARRYVLDAVGRTMARERREVVSDVERSDEDWGHALTRLGSGSVGGKARGIVFMHKLLCHPRAGEVFAALPVRVPRAVLIATDSFARFVEKDRLHEWALTCEDDAARTSRFLAQPFWYFMNQHLRRVIETLDGPLAVRSSSLLEDHQFRPFSGIYATYMLPNNHPDLAERVRQLAQAIKAVYASAYSRGARAYMRGTPYAFGQEQMGVVVQEVVGRAHGTRFYPDFAGVALSQNDYPAAGQRGDEGLGLVALGLGHTVVSGGRYLRFSPGAPQILPQFHSPQAMLQESQRRFYCIDLTRAPDFHDPLGGTLVLADLDVAEADGTLHAVGSVYCAEDNSVRDTLSIPGPRLVTFHNILKYQVIPLAETLRSLLTVCRTGLGSAVEIEFAVDTTGPSLSLLQVRPAGGSGEVGEADMDAVPSTNILAESTHALGHGRRTIVDVVQVRTDAPAREVVAAIAALNERLCDYMLIGPGRWGSADPALGIPVRWQHIDRARVLVETKKGDRVVEPSQGTHFFQNMTAMGVFYLSIPDFDDRWLGGPWGDGWVRHVRLAEPVTVLVAGSQGRAAIYRGDGC